jgi:hypothetical protein
MTVYQVGLTIATSDVSGMLSEVKSLVIRRGYEESPALVSAENLILSEARRMLCSLDCVPVDCDVHVVVLLGLG